MHNHEHNHHHQLKGSLRSLILVFIIGVVICAIEIYGSATSGSLSLLSDAGHIASDISSFLVSIIAILYSKKRSNRGMNFGYGRAEILAALTNAILLFTASIFIFYESIDRLNHSNLVDPISIIKIGFIALVGNSISAFVLHSYSDNNLNLKSAYLHIISDLVTSIGVILGGILIYYTKYNYIDSIISFLISILILRFSYKLAVASVKVLMEGFPSSIDRNKLEEDILLQKGIHFISELKAWSITSNSHAIFLSLVIDSNFEESSLKKSLHDNFGFHEIFISVKK
ncbi:MAG: cation diffusion facilitator family transporter [Leptospiraceae bacterium]|nr:cation diffusion facilitator family transporter [Leptospiraceae bacterium]